MKTNRKRPQARNKINDDYYQSRHWKIIRVKALTRDDYRCQECKRQGRIKEANTVDHIVPISKGFADNMPPEEITRPENLRFIPWKDNLIKGAKG